MFKRQAQKIPCYVLIYDQYDIIKKSLDTLVRDSDRLDIVVCENPSQNSKQIAKYVKQLGEAGKIKRYYQFHDNITSIAMHTALEREKQLIKKSKYVVISDGDVTTNDDWLSEEIAVMEKHREVFTIGVTLDRSNLPVKTFPDADKWLPDDKADHGDYIEVITGTHLELLRGPEFYKMLEWKDKNNFHLVDSLMHRYAEEVLHKKWARTKRASAYHLTWDLYLDLEHPYTKRKLGLTFEEIWHHKRTSDYTLTEY